MSDELKCMNSGCDKPAVWVRCTQFAGDHPFCEACARKEKDFGKEISGQFFWYKIAAKKSGKKKGKNGR